MSAFTDLDIKARQNFDFVIHPFDEEDGVTPIGYDLSIGCAVLLTGDDDAPSISSTFGETDNSTGESIEVQPNSSALIITKEHVWFSPSVLGTLHARGSLAASGLFVNSTTIDPNWKGQLTVLMRNTNSNPIKLRIGQKFLTLVFHQTLTGTTNEPSSDPVRVAKYYGEIYGRRLSDKILEFLVYDEINKKIKTDFDKLVIEAKKPSLIDYINDITINKIPIIKNTLGKKAIESINAIFFFLAIGMFFVSLTIQFYWPTVQNIFGFKEAYDIKIVMPQLALIVSSMVLIRGFTKKD